MIDKYPPTNLIDKDPPTHRCKICGAYWISYPRTEDLPGSWSLYSPRCGECCDNAVMADQIVDLNTEAFDRANRIILY